MTDKIHVDNKILNLEDIKGMSIDDIIRLYRDGYRLESSLSILPKEQIENIVNLTPEVSLIYSEGYQQADGIHMTVDILVRNTDPYPLVLQFKLYSEEAIPTYLTSHIACIQQYSNPQNGNGCTKIRITDVLLKDPYKIYVYRCIDAPNCAIPNCVRFQSTWDSSCIGTVETWTGVIPPLTSFPTAGVTKCSGGTLNMTTDCASCTPSWVCEQPLNGYEYDSCTQQRRPNTACNPTIPATTISITTDSTTPFSQAQSIRFYGDLRSAINPYPNISGADVVLTIDVGGAEVVRQHITTTSTSPNLIYDWEVPYEIAGVNTSGMVIAVTVYFAQTAEYQSSTYTVNYSVAGVTCTDLVITTSKTSANVGDKISITTVTNPTTASFPVIIKVDGRRLGTCTTLPAPALQAQIQEQIHTHTRGIQKLQENIYNIQKQQNNINSLQNTISISNPPAAVIAGKVISFHIDYNLTVNWWGELIKFRICSGGVEIGSSLQSHFGNASGATSIDVTIPTNAKGSISVNAEVTRDLFSGCGTGIMASTTPINITVSGSVNVLTIVDPHISAVTGQIVDIKLSYTLNVDWWGEWVRFRICDTIGNELGNKLMLLFGNHTDTITVGALAPNMAGRITIKGEVTKNQFSGTCGDPDVIATTTLSTMGIVEQTTNTISLIELPIVVRAGQAVDFKISYNLSLDWWGEWIRFRICAGSTEIGNVIKLFFGTVTGIETVNAVIPSNAIDIVSIKAEVTLDQFNSTCGNSVLAASSITDIPVGIAIPGGCQLTWDTTGYEIGTHYIQAEVLGHCATRVPFEVKLAPPGECTPDGYIHIYSTPPGATALVDGYEVGTTSSSPSSPLIVRVANSDNPHLVEIRLAGYETWTDDINVCSTPTIVHPILTQPSPYELHLQLGFDTLPSYVIQTLSKLTKIVTDTFAVTVPGVNINSVNYDQPSHEIVIEMQESSPSPIPSVYLQQLWKSQYSDVIYIGPNIQYLYNPQSDIQHPTIQTLVLPAFAVILILAAVSALITAILMWLGIEIPFYNFRKKEVPITTELQVKVCISLSESTCATPLEPVTVEFNGEKKTADTANSFTVVFSNIKTVSTGSTYPISAYIPISPDSKVYKAGYGLPEFGGTPLTLIPGQVNTVELKLKLGQTEQRDYTPPCPLKYPDNSDVPEGTKLRIVQVLKNKVGYTVIKDYGIRTVRADKCVDPTKVPVYLTDALLDFQVIPEDISPNSPDPGLIRGDQNIVKRIGDVKCKISVFTYSTVNNLITADKVEVKDLATQSIFKTIIPTSGIVDIDEIPSGDYEVIVTKAGYNVNSCTPSCETGVTCSGCQVTFTGEYLQTASFTIILEATVPTCDISIYVLDKDGSALKTTPYITMCKDGKCAAEQIVTGNKLDLQEVAEGTYTFTIRADKYKTITDKNETISCTKPTLIFKMDPTGEDIVPAAMELNINGQKGAVSIGKNTPFTVEVTGADPTERVEIRNISTLPDTTVAVGDPDLAGYYTTSLTFDSDTTFDIQALQGCGVLLCRKNSNIISLKVGAGAKDCLIPNPLGGCALTTEAVAGVGTFLLAGILGIAAIGYLFMRAPVGRERVVTTIPSERGPPKTVVTERTETLAGKAIGEVSKLA